MIANVIAVLIFVAIIGAVVFYLVKQKKKGATCIGCPYAKECNGHCDGCHEFSEKVDDKQI